MKYEVKLKSSVKKILQKQKWQAIVEQFNSAVKILTQDPKTKELDIIFLQNTPNRYRLRIWKYRFLFWEEKQELIFVFYDAGSRWDIYK